MMWGNEFGWVGMLFGGLMMVAFWGGLIALGFFALHALAYPGGGHTTASRAGERPLEALKERYARGEITKEQYETMRRDLSL